MLLDSAVDPEALLRWSTRERIYPVRYKNAAEFRRDILILKDRGILSVGFVRLLYRQCDEDAFEWMDAQGIECDINLLPDESLE